jgi:hypothetical protein
MEVMETVEMADMVDSEGTLTIWNALGGDIGSMELC